MKVSPKTTNGCTKTYCSNVSRFSIMTLKQSARDFCIKASLSQALALPRGVLNKNEMQIPSVLKLNCIDGPPKIKLVFLFFICIYCLYMELCLFNKLNCYLQFTYRATVLCFLGSFIGLAIASQCSIVSAILDDVFYSMRSLYTRTKRGIFNLTACIYVILKAAVSTCEVENDNFIIFLLEEKKTSEITEVFFSSWFL